jgi:hypothetical protein
MASNNWDGLWSGNWEGSDGDSASLSGSASFSIACSGDLSTTSSRYYAPNTIIYPPKKHKIGSSVRIGAFSYYSVNVARRSVLRSSVNVYLSSYNRVAANTKQIDLPDIIPGVFVKPKPAQQKAYIPAPSVGGVAIEISSNAKTRLLARSSVALALSAKSDVKYCDNEITLEDVAAWLLMCA